MRVEFFRWVGEYIPKEGVLYLDKLNTYVDHHWKVQQPQYVLEFTDYTGVPEFIKQWLATEFCKKNCPKTLCLWGPTRVGKMDWARHLGKFHLISI